MIPGTRRKVARFPFGLSMVEVVLSSFVVAVVLAAALQTVASAGRTRLTAERRWVARELAQSLLTEIMLTRFKDPDQTPAWGPEAGETTRAQFDDVDDYDGWYEAPVQDAAGTPLAGYEHWNRWVLVEYVDVAPAVSGDSQACKRITVTVEFDGVSMFSLPAVYANRDGN